MDEPKNEDTMLSRAGNLGKTILQLAKDKYDEARKEMVLRKVQFIMDERDRLRHMEESARTLAERCEAQLKAFAEERFTIEERTGRIIFADSDLNNEPRRDAHGNPVWD